MPSAATSLLGVHLFLGPDRPRKFQRIQELERALQVQPLDRHHVDAATTPAPHLLALCRQQPAMSAARLIVVEEAHRLDRAGVEGLLQHAGSIAHTACVVLLAEVELGLRHALARVSSEIRTERFPGRETVAVKPFAFTDALGSRDAAGALMALEDQLGAGKEPLELLGLIAWQVNRWVLVKRLSEAGWGVERIAVAAALKPWQVERLRSETASRSLEALQGLLRRCWQLDVEAKSGRAIPELAIEQLVLETCA